MPTRDMLGLGRAITLRQRILALVAVAVLPSAAALIYLILSVQSGREAEVYSAALRGSHTAAIEVEEVLGNVEAVLLTAAAAVVEASPRTAAPISPRSSSAHQR